MAKHSSGRRGVTSTAPARLYAIEIVDARTGVIDVPEAHHHEPERGRAEGVRPPHRRRQRTMLLVHEAVWSWTIHGLGASGVTLSAADMIALAESILAHAQPGGAR